MPLESLPYLPSLIVGPVKDCDFLKRNILFDIRFDMFYDFSCFFTIIFCLLDDNTFAIIVLAIFEEDALAFSIFRIVM